MPLVRVPILQPVRCNWEVAEGRNYNSLLCGKPAIVVVSRRQLGQLALCREHMNNPDVYRDVEARGWTWRVVCAT